MASVDIDTILHVYQSTEYKLIGHSSKYTDEVHPGTNQKIEGWKWDERIWPTEGEFRAVAYAPSIWDPSLSGIDEDYLQAGYGDNKDLLLLDIETVIVEDTDIWAPRLQHGYFYTRDQEWYLYSDAYITQYFTVTGVEDDRQVLTLERAYKPTIPIQVRSYKWNRTFGQYEIYRDFRKKVEFSDDPEGPEFIINTDTNPPKVILDNLYEEAVGSEITLSASGTADPSLIYGLDLVGLSDGSDDQEFQLTYSPVDEDSTIQVWTWTDANWPHAWTIIDSLDEFTPGAEEVKVDTDRGIIRFSEVGSGIVPAGGYHVGVHYTIGTQVMYEPADTIDNILAYNASADTNPIASAINRGFVQISTESMDPANISLSADLTIIANTYTIELGNNIGELTAEVKNIAEDLLEGQEVTFELLDPMVGTFGASAETAVAVTGGDGEATTLYNSPPTTQGLGRATVTVSHNAGDTIVQVEGITEPVSLDDIFIYKVHQEDEVLGILEDDLQDYYEDYLEDQGITEGIQATVGFEEDFRVTHGLGSPTTYAADDYITGKKTIMLTTKSGEVMDPHSGEIKNHILTPLTPSAIENIGTDTSPILKLTYQGVSLDLPGTVDTKAYFVVGNATTQIRAYVTNQRTNRRIYSNTINLEVQIPDIANGTYYCNVLNDIPDGLLTKTKNVLSLTTAQIDATSGIDEYFQAYEEEKLWIPASGIHEYYHEWFTRTRRGDTVGLTEIAELLADSVYDGLEEITPVDCPAEIPLGFRLKSTGVTIASVLDQITYLNPNDHLVSGYFL